MISRRIANHRFAVLSTVSVVGVHHLGWLLAPHAAPTGGDHSGSDLIFGATLIGLLVALGAVTALNVQRLRRLLLEFRVVAAPVPGTSRREFLTSLLRLTAALVASTGCLYVVQENVERLIAGEQASGLAVLGTFPIALVVPVALAVAALGLLVRIGRGIRERVRRSVRRRPIRTTPPILPPAATDMSRLPDCLLGSSLASRAPPPRVELA